MQSFKTLFLNRNFQPTRDLAHDRTELRPASLYARGGSDWKSADLSRGTLLQIFILIIINKFYLMKNIIN